jgi:hypothetical protein
MRRKYCYIFETDRYILIKTKTGIVYQFRTVLLMDQLSCCMTILGVLPNPKMYIRLSVIFSPMFHLSIIYTAYRPISEFAI